MSNYGYEPAPRDGAGAPVLFRVSEPRRLELSSLTADLDDFANLASLAALLGSEEHRYWRRSRQDEVRIVRLSYGSPLEVIALMPDMANAIAPHMFAGASVLIVNQVIKQIRASFRDYAVGRRDLSEAEKFRAEADKARAEAEDTRVRSARARYELEQERKRNLVSEEESAARLATPDLLFEAAAELPPQARQNLLDMLETLRREDEQVIDRRGSSAPAQPGISKERSIIHSIARMILKDEVSIGPHTGG